jgi:hypothetical protein
LAFAIGKTVDGPPNLTDGVKVFPVSAGTTYTFYLNGTAAGFAFASLFQASLTALYVPGILKP